MIIGNIKTYKSCGMSTADLDKYIELLKTITTETPDGRYELSDGAYYLVKGNVILKPADVAVYESHEKYIDIQYVLEGIEEMGYANTTELTVTTPYNADKDCTLYDSKGGSLITFKAGDFAVFAPMDGHKPGCGIGTSKKVIVKVPVK